MNMGNKSRRKLNILKDNIMAKKQINTLNNNIMANSNKRLFKRNIIMENKKLIFGVLLTFLVCLSSTILASYMTNPVDTSLKYPNPGHYPGEIGPGTFNCSETTGCYFEFPDDSGATGFMVYNGSAYVYKTLSIFDYPGINIDFVNYGNTQLGNDSSDKTIVKGDLNVTGNAAFGGSNINPNVAVRTEGQDFGVYGVGNMVGVAGVVGGGGVAAINGVAPVGTNAWSGWFQGGKGVKIEGDLNVSGGIERPKTFVFNRGFKVTRNGVTTEHGWNVLGWKGKPISLQDLFTKINNSPGNDTCSEIAIYVYNENLSSHVMCIWTNGVLFDCYPHNWPGADENTLIQPGFPVLIHLEGCDRYPQLSADFMTQFYIYVDTLEVKDEIIDKGDAYIGGDLDVSGGIERPKTFMFNRGFAVTRNGVTTGHGWNVLAWKGKPISLQDLFTKINNSPGKDTCSEIQIWVYNEDLSSYDMCRWTNGVLAGCYPHNWPGADENTLIQPGFPVLIYLSGCDRYPQLSADYMTQFYIYVDKLEVKDEIIDKGDAYIGGDLEVSGGIERTGYVKGDCDKNGVVNMEDVQCINDYTSGLNTNCDEADVDCDINGDGVVDFNDVLILGRILTGAYNAIDYLPFDSIASISPYAKFEAYGNMPAIKADATGSTAYAGYFTGGKGVKIEGDLNVTGNTQLGNSSSDKTTVKGDLNVSGDIKVKGELSPYTNCEGVLVGNAEGWMTAFSYNGNDVCSHYGGTCLRVYFWQNTDKWEVYNCSTLWVKEGWWPRANSFAGHIYQGLACCK